MNKITKLFLVILSAVSMHVYANAGELTVTGGATATMVQGNDHSAHGKALGVSNEIDFTATGELDNGFSWKWQAQMDGATNLNDDTRLEVGTPYGTVAMYISEGDLSSKLGYGIGAMGVGDDYKNTFSTATGNVVWGKNLGGYNNVQYHTPADLLPLGIALKVGYAPNLSDGDGASAKASGAMETNALGEDAVQTKITASPIDGLSIGADYVVFDGPLTTTRYKEEAAGAFAKYAKGPVTIGYAVTGNQPMTAAASTTVNYESTMYGVQFAVNDALSLSYSVADYTKHTSSALSNAGAVTAASDIDMDTKHIQAAYVVGGATLGVAIVETDNDDFTTGASAKLTTFSVAMAF